MRTYVPAAVQSPFLLPLLVLLALLTGGCGGPSLTTNSWAIGGGSQGGVYLPLATGIADIIKTEIPGTIFAAQQTKGSVDNLKLLMGKEIQLAIVQHDVALYSYKGEENFVGNGFPQLRILAELYVEGLQITVKEKSPIKTLADLKGKKIVLGPDKSGTYVTASLVFEEAGIFDKIDPVFEKFNESLDLLQSDKVDAVCIMSGIPHQSIQNSAKVSPLRFLPVPAKLISKIKQKHGYYSTYNISSRSYPGLGKMVETIGIRALLVSSSQVPKEDIKTIMGILLKNSKKLESFHDLGSEFNAKPDEADLEIPLHEGLKK